MTSLYPGEDEMLSVLEILALSDDAMMVVDDRRRIVFWNRGVQALFGYTHDEVAGRSCALVLAGCDDYGNRYCCDTCPVQAITRRGEHVRPFRLRCRAKDATMVPVDVSILKFTLRQSKRVLLAHVMRPAETAHAPVPQPPRHNGEHADARVRELTTREVEILSMLASGRNTRSIADTLTISPLTARNHIQHIFEKLEVHSQSEAVAFAFRMHIV